MSIFIPNQLSLAPLGAGDLIDRAVRLYRRHLFILIRVAAPPVIVAAGGWGFLSLSFRQLMLSPEIADVVLYLILGALGCVIVLGGYLFTLVVMGGATRNLVAHLLSNDPVSARTTYNAVRTRFWGLLDRKSTRLNSSHLGISYAVFCLKKKKKQNIYVYNYSR